MKKVTLYILLAVTVLFSLSACNKLSDLEKTLKNSDITNVVIEIHNSTGTQVSTQSIDGNKAKLSGGGLTNYIERDGDKYYRYSETVGKWNKEDVTDYVLTYSIAVFSYAAYLFDFAANDFTDSDDGYSMIESARQAYCERIFVKQWESLDAQVHFAEVEYLTLKISNGKISELEVKSSLILDDLPIQTNTIKLLLSGYGTVKVELPKLA